MRASSFAFFLCCALALIACDPSSDPAGGPTACTTASDCDDEIACTTDTCSAGTCTHAAVDAACDDGVACTSDVCTTASGCVHTPEAGACDDGVACTSDACDPAEGCVHTADDALCADGVDCTVDTCDAASGCAHAADDALCADGVDCTVDTCDGASGCAHAADDSLCADGVDCTVDTCDGASGCAHAADDALCADGVDCTVDTCDLALGCSQTPDHGLCGDGVGCTIDVCDAGLGCSSTPDDGACDDGLACTADSCSSALDCVHAVDHGACDDGFACTTNWCSTVSGCQASADDVLCDDGFECTAELCSTSAGCEYSLLAEAVSCYDGLGSCDGVGACVADLGAPIRVAAIDDFTRFGYTVDFRYYDGVVGGPNDGGAGVGAAFALVASHPAGADSVYSLGQKLVPDAPAAGPWYGESVATHGAAHFVGDPSATVGSDDLAGVVHVFRRPVSTWVVDELLTSPDPGPSQRFGLGVTARYDLVTVREIVGSYPSTYSRLHIYRCTTQCAFVQTLSGPGSHFARAVAIARDDLLAVGDPSSGGDGQVRLYQADPETGLFAQYATLSPPEPRTESQGFGMSVAATAHHVFVGEAAHDVPGVSRGAVHVYSADLNATSFAFVQTLVGAGDVDNFGSSLSARAFATEVRLAVRSLPVLGGKAHVHLVVGPTYRGSTRFREVLAARQPSDDFGDDFGRQIVVTAEGDLLVGAPYAFVATDTVYGALYSYEWP